MREFPVLESDFRGQYVPGEYPSGCIVTHEGRAWRATSRAAGDDEPGVSGVWDMLVDRGEKGDAGPQGAQGEAGQPGRDGEDGRGFTPRGFWNGTNEVYRVDDLVRYLGGTYRRRTDGSGNAPGVDNAGWESWAEKGDTGPKGDTGESFDPDFVGVRSARSQHDASPGSTSYLASDEGLLYFKITARFADWSDGIPFGKGEKGDPGEVGPAGADGAQGPPGADGSDGADGARGEQGIQGVPGVPGADGQRGATGAQGVKGDTGATGPGVATGGSAGQVLTKTGAADFAAEWANPSGGDDMLQLSRGEVALASGTNALTAGAFGKMHVAGTNDALVLLPSSANNLGRIIGVRNTVFEVFVRPASGERISGATGDTLLPRRATFLLLAVAGGYELLTTPPPASINGPGIVELATDAETKAGTDSSRVVTPAGWNSAFLARLERVFSAASYIDDMNQAQETGVFRVVSAPKIQVPALGSPPPGAKWVMDVIGMIRVAPPPADAAGPHSNLFRVSINGSFVSGICGGKDWVPGVGQSMCPVFAYGIAPPTLTSGFTVEFSMWSQFAGAWRTRSGDNPVVRAYLVAA